MPDHDQELETRDVRVDDPSLSPRAREALTDELQKAVGAKRVQVPRCVPHREHDVRRPGHAFGRLSGRDRLLIAVTACMALVVGAIVALASHHWWILLVPVGVHALATLAVGFMVIQMSTQPEAPDPTVTAMLDDEGVPEPERAFNDLVEEFTGEPDARGATEVVVTGHDDNAGVASQRSAMTPSATPTEPVAGGLVMGVEWFIVLGLAVASVVMAIALGDLAWLLPAVMLPFCGGWAAYQVLAEREADHRVERPAGDEHTAARRATLITVAGVVAIEVVAIVVVILATATT